MAKRSRDQEIKAYYQRMFAEHGHTMYCPVCRWRPCILGCRLGIYDEEELTRMAARLAEKDPKQKKRKK